MTKQTGVPDSGQPLEPSNDTIRIATALGSHPDRSLPGLEAVARSSSKPVSAASVEALIRQRALRSMYVPGKVLAEPAWDMLLELLHAELTERSVVASILCKAAGISNATGLRWIDVLVSQGLCIRTTGPSTVCIQLSEHGSEAMRGYFAELAASPE